MRIALPNQNTSEQPALIKVIGVGGGGTNAVNRMIAANVSNVEFYVVNTDASALRMSSCENKVQIGADGLGVGGNPDRGEISAVESEESLKDMLEGANMVFITAGMGGGTGTGAAPIVARLAREKGILTVGVVTKPFKVESKRKMDYADKGIENLKQYVDTLIVIPNDRVFSVVDEKTPVTESYKLIDDVLRRSIETITDIITKTGEWNIDFADVESVLRNSDSAIIGLGDGQTLEEAFQKALVNVFVEGPDIKSATNILINVSFSKTNMVLTGQLQSFYNYISSEFKQCDSAKLGNVVEDVLDTKIKVSIIGAFNKKAEETIPADLFTIPVETIRKEAPKTKKIDINSLTSRPAYEFWKSKRL